MWRFINESARVYDFRSLMFPKTKRAANFTSFDGLVDLIRREAA